MQEQAFRFGRAQHMVGIAGLPAASAHAVGVVVLNAGLVHRVGPFRLHVELTRRLNACGYPTLRFDLSTVGDSGASGESQTRTEQVCADVHDAVVLLKQQSGCTQVVLFGLCSGAQNAHTVACSETQVAGAIFLDGYAYRTFGYRARHYLPRLFDARRWLRARTDGRNPSMVRSTEPVFSVARLPRKIVCADFAGMLDRGLKLCFIYSGGISNYFNHRRQFRECFGRVITRTGVSTRFIGEADHTYILAGDRDRLLDHIEHWLSDNFPIATAGTQP